MIYTQKIINNEDIKYLNASKEMYMKSIKRLNIPDNFIYQKKISSEETGIWINEIRREIIISFRGDINSVHDVLLKTFLKYKHLKDSWRFKTTINHIREIKNTHPKYIVTYTGCNLGGEIALELLWKYIKDTCIIFDVENKSINRYKGLNVSWYVCDKKLLDSVDQNSFQKMIFIELDICENGKDQYVMNTLLDMYGT